jgi:hypothetical protein
MYDERATDSLAVSAYNKEFIEKTEPTGDTVKNTNTNLQFLVNQKIFRF